MTIVPLILIPQIMLAGLIAKVSSPLVEVLSYLTLSRWGVEGFNDIQNRVVVENADFSNTTMEAIPMLLSRFHENYEKLFTLHGTIELDTYVITFMIIIMLVFIYRTLKKKDSVTL